MILNLADEKQEVERGQEHDVAVGAHTTNDQGAQLLKLDDALAATCDLRRGSST